MDNFLKNNIIFFCGTMVVSVFNYLYHPILGRMMSVEKFGKYACFFYLLKLNFNRFID